MTDLTRRAALGVAGVGTLAALTAGFPRLSGLDIPSRRTNALKIALNGTQQTADAQAGLVKAFRKKHPDIDVMIMPIQGADWGDFFAKILTMVAAGTPPDVVNVATEGAQLFASRLAHPLDDYVKQDTSEMRDYFSDVHPALIDAFMYRGSLFQLPDNFNAGNVFMNTKALRKAGFDYPPENWTKDDFVRMLRAIKRTSGHHVVPFYWTNRMWGGVTPWLYTNNTSILKQTEAAGGEWLWDTFYSGAAGARGRGGGPLWLEAQADSAPVEETFEFLRELITDGLASSPAQGGGNTLVPQFASGRVAMTVAGGYWVDGLHQAGIPNDVYDVQYMPKWKSQNAQFGAAGWSIMKTSEKKDAAWEWLKFCVSREGMGITYPIPNNTPTRRSMCNGTFYGKEGPKHWKVFYDTLDDFPGTRPIPAPPNESAIELALDKNTINAVTGGPRQLKSALRSLQGDLSRALEETP
ncbi:MAG TPA: sugar ABC transporter substrate-binding protein [Flexivirga sp.]|uniref:ABC transporter substrate-binding protein n=1 Tax=Flexivirga sp. TaxID=1962927 RepID=UPI002B86B8B6|nr:sugar ABC transporter substrate-binding protein [Flexivirga sp.]HWC24391.1 sugar ABC transporter substrate-binding protein [Flexivirga sp.]